MSKPNIADLVAQHSFYELTTDPSCLEDSPPIPHYDPSEYIIEAQRQGRLQKGFHSGIVNKANLVFGWFFRFYYRSYDSAQSAEDTLDILSDSEKSPVPEDHAQFKQSGGASKVAQEVKSFWPSFKWLWGVDEGINLFTAYQIRGRGGRIGDTEWATIDHTDYKTYKSFINPRELERKRK